jgi:hypothetical protein
MDATPYLTRGWTAIEIGPDLLTTIFISVAVFEQAWQVAAAGSSSHLNKEHVWSPNSGPPTRRFFVNNSDSQAHPQLRLPVELPARARPSRSRGNGRARTMYVAQRESFEPPCFGLIQIYTPSNVMSFQVRSTQLRLRASE